MNNKKYFIIIIFLIVITIIFNIFLYQKITQCNSNKRIYKTIVTNIDSENYIPKDIRDSIKIRYSEKRLNKSDSSLIKVLYDKERFNY